MAGTAPGAVLARLTWAILTGEYPPHLGGVGDYTRQLAGKLAEAGDEVHVWTGPRRGDSPADLGVHLHHLSGQFGLASLVRLDRELSRLRRPVRLLVQYVPHAFGWKAMNYPFCLWLRTYRRYPVWVMFHEVAFPVGRSQSWKHNLLGCVTRLMAATLARSGRRLFVSTPAWETVLRALVSVRSRITWLPVPSNLPTDPPPEQVACIRRQLATDPGALILGHFGTFGPLIVPELVGLLGPLLAADPRRIGLLIGPGGDRFARTLEEAYPTTKGRLFATGLSPGPAAASHLAACDLLLQPYPDGVTTRRGSLMAGLALGRAIVTTRGHLSEEFWDESGAVLLAPADNPGMALPAVEALLTDPERRARLGEQARLLYQRTFAIEHSIRRLRLAEDGD
jgi:glycosyltransferase involved in cell wall biosynthesis